jgi:hypothetical protein
VHLVTGAADQSGGRFKLGAGMPSAVNKHVGRHVGFLPMGDLPVMIAGAFTGSGISWTPLDHHQYRYTATDLMVSVSQMFSLEPLNQLVELLAKCIIERAKLGDRNKDRLRDAALIHLAEAKLHKRRS